MDRSFLGQRQHRMWAAATRTWVAAVRAAHSWPFTSLFRSEIHTEFLVHFAVEDRGERARNYTFTKIFLRYMIHTGMKQ